MTPEERKRLGRSLQGLSVNPAWSLRPEVLTHGPIPFPMHGLAPRVVLGEAWWRKARNAAYRSTSFHCIACGVPKEKADRRQLEAHEVYEIDWLMGRMHYEETVPVCPFCHGFIHSGRLRALLEKRLVTAQRYASIIQHGEAILEKHGLEVKDYRGPQADWGDWRLVIDGKEYPPLYSCFDEYRRVHL